MSFTVSMFEKIDFVFIKLEPPGGQGAQRVGNKQLDHV